LDKNYWTIFLGQKLSDNFSWTKTTRQKKSEKSIKKFAPMEKGYTLKLSVPNNKQQTTDNRQQQTGDNMTQAEAIMYIEDAVQAAEAARSTAIAEDQYWASETSVFVFDDNSSIAFSGLERLLINTPKAKMLIGLMGAKERGVKMVWYGHVENAEPIGIDEAIFDVLAMDEDMFSGGSSWGEWSVEA